VLCLDAPPPPQEHTPIRPRGFTWQPARPSTGCLVPGRGQLTCSLCVCVRRAVGRSVVTAGLSQHSDAQRTAIAAAGGIGAALRGVERHALGLVRSRGCAALGNIACENPANQNAIVRGDGVAVLSSAMRAHPADPEVQRYCAYALSWVCKGHGVAQRQMARAGGMELIFDALESHRSDGAASVASFEAAVLTEIYLCNVCSCQEVLRRNGHG
jgi:hypothetical protein